MPMAHAQDASSQPRTTACHVSVHNSEHILDVLYSLVHVCRPRTERIARGVKGCGLSL